CPGLAVSAQQQSSVTKPSTRQSAKADPRFIDVEALLQQGRVSEAKQKIQDILAQDPKSVEGYNLLGIACISQKDYDAALAALERALQLDPSSPRTKNNLGNLYVAQEKLDLAEKQFRDVLRTAPGNSDANYNLGVLLLASKQPAAAI